MLYRKVTKIWGVFLINLIATCFHCCGADGSGLASAVHGDMKSPEPREESWALAPTEPYHWNPPMGSVNL